MSVNSSRVSGPPLSPRPAEKTTGLCEAHPDITNTVCRLCPPAEALRTGRHSDLMSSDYLRLCHSVTSAARGRKSLVKRLHSDWVAPRVLVGRSAGEAVDAGRGQLRVFLFQSNSGHCAT